jgi:hypothetical protein
VPSARIHEVISDRDIWVAALRMVQDYTDDAVLEAVERGRKRLEEGDLRGAITWHCIISAIERLQARQPARGEAVH